jgi:hypothetical protein
MFQQGSRASAAFELPVVHPLHASTSRQPPRSAPAINRTRSAPTTYNQIHHVSQPSRQPSQLSLLNPRAPPEALRVARRIAGNQRPNALDLPEGLSSARRMAGDTPQRQTVSCACSNQAPLPQTKYLQAQGPSSARRMARDAPQRQNVSRACSNQAPFPKTNYLQAQELSSARRMARDAPQRRTVSRACSDQVPFPKTNYLQARRQSRHVRFDIPSEMSASASTPSSGHISEAPPLRVRSAPLPPVTTVLVESETESDSSLSPEVRNCFVDLIMMIGLLPGS